MKSTQNKLPTRYYITTSQGLTHVTKKNKRTVKKTPKLQDHMTNNAQDKKKKKKPYLSAIFLSREF